MQGLKYALPGLLYLLVSMLGALMVWDWLVTPDWWLCGGQEMLCLQPMGWPGSALLHLYGILGVLLLLAFGFMLYRFIRLGGARREVNQADRLLLHKTVQEIRNLCRQHQYGQALMLVESLRQKYPDNRQVRELEQRLNRALDHQQ